MQVLGSVMLDGRHVELAPVDLSRVVGLEVGDAARVDASRSARRWQSTERARKARERTHGLEQIDLRGGTGWSTPQPPCHGERRRRAYDEAQNVSKVYFQDGWESKTNHFVRH